MAPKDLSQKTIDDFGQQWATYTDNSGLYGSADYFKDVLAGLIPIEDFNGAVVLDVGSGSGRIVNMLLDVGAREVWAVEPAKGAFESLQVNTESRKEKVKYLNVRGDEIPPAIGADLAVSLGVMHHIPEPAPAMRAIFNALRPGGRCFIWLYGREGNEAYLRVVEPLRAVTTRLPDWGLSALCNVLAIGLDLYIQMCRLAPLPMRDYALKVLRPLARDKRRLVIYDQLNPAYAKYYTKDEAINLLAEAGFAEIEIRHRHGYSWSVSGVRK